MKATAVLLLGLCACSLVCRNSEAFAVHQGCYLAVADGARALAYKAVASDSMTIELCRKAAATRGVSAFALEAGRECWLDPANGNATYLARFGAGSNCDVPCTGDSRIVCGGQLQDDLYVENDPNPMGVPPYDCTSAGCFKDDVSARRMTLLWVSPSSMTIDLCAHIAYTEQWPVFGLQYGSGGSECWGGQALDSVKALGPSTGCSSTCPGNTAQSCGGTLALNVFALKDVPWLNTKTETTTQPKALTAADCVGAAASSAACKALLTSGTQAPRMSLGTGLAVALVTALLWLQ